MFHDKSFIQALINTAKLMAVVPVITIFCSLVLAFVLNQCKLKEMVLYRTLFYFPNIVSLTVVGIIWSFVFHPNVGIVNKILGAVGLESLQRSWLGDSKTALWCIAFTLLWQAAGYYMVMHIAAMDGISPEIYESATLDGASAWRKLISITMPLMKDIIGITFVQSIGTFLFVSAVFSVAFLIAGIPVYLAFIFGGIALATAPAPALDRPGIPYRGSRYQNPDSPCGHR